MKPFDRTDEATETGMPSERLQAYLRTIWDALVPASGECVSVQGELIRANERLQAELYRNGMGNYYGQDEPGDGLRDNYYGALLLLVLDTLIENRGRALADDDVAYFASMRGLAERNWLTQLRSDELNDKGPELSDAEKAELERLESLDERIYFEDLFNRAERCIANWCIANSKLIDRECKPIEEGGVSDLMHIFDPPPPPLPCPICQGRGWIPATDPSAFPEFCSCKKAVPNGRAGP